MTTESKRLNDLDLVEEKAGELAAKVEEARRLLVELVEIMEGREVAREEIDEPWFEAIEDLSDESLCAAEHLEQQGL